jgi:hypothetical protein
MQLRPGPWLTLLACLGAVGAVSAQTGAQAEAPGRAEPRAPVGPLRPSDTAPLPWPDWHGAPVALSGSLAYEFRASRADRESNAQGQLVTGTLNANSYIYEPWFATVSGTLGVTAGRSRGGGEIPTSDSGITLDLNSSAERFLTGKGQLNLFPRSRFPFEFHVERSDSRTELGLAPALDFTTQNVGFSQRYRPLVGDYALSARFDRREQFGSGFRDTQDELSGDVTTRWKHTEASLGLSQSVARREASDERTSFQTLVGHHLYAPSNAVSINTTVNWSRTDERLVGYASDMSVFQWSTVGLWRPESTRLSLNGSIRGLLLRDDAGGRTLDSVSASLGASYEINRNARLNASGTATSTHSNGEGALLFSGSVGAGWQSDTIELPGRLRYDWYASGTAGGSRGGEASHSILNAQAGHSLSRVWSITRQSTLTLNGSQGLVAAYSRTGGEAPDEIGPLSRFLNHSVGATWNASGDSTSAYTRLSYSDARELGGANARFRLWNFQLSGTWSFDRNSSISGDLTAQRVEQRSGDTLHDGERVLGGQNESHSTSGEIAYRHGRMFGVPRLRFTSRLKLAQDVLKQPGTLTTIPDRETRLWENRLDWAIGRLDTQLVFRVSEVDARRRKSLMVRVQRSFGG